MKHLFFLSVLLFITFFSAKAANFKSDDEVVLDEIQKSDLYVAAGEINISAPVRGDLVASGGDITVEDSVYGDLLVAGGNLEVEAFIGDDIRVAAGEISIRSVVRGDVIVFGGSLEISENALIYGDVICFGGEIRLHGKINGNVKIFGGEVSIHNEIGGNVEVKSGMISFHGKVEGDMTLQAEEISLGPDASCKGRLRYWHNGEELDFTGICEDAQFDKDLKIGGEEADWSLLGTMFGLGLIAYWVIYILSSFVILLLLEHFLGRYFESIIPDLKDSFFKSFGYGMMYLIGAPVLTLLAFITIIGIPVGLFTMSIYTLSLIFGTSIIGLTLGYYFRQKTASNWTHMQMVAYSLGIVVIIKILFIIPWLGTMLKTVAMASVYGAFLMRFFEGVRKKEKA